MINEFKKGKDTITKLFKYGSKREDFHTERLDIEKRRFKVEENIEKIESHRKKIQKVIDFTIKKNSTYSGILNKYYGEELRSLSIKVEDCQKEFYDFIKPDLIKYIIEPLDVRYDNKKGLHTRSCRDNKTDNSSHSNPG